MNRMIAGAALAGIALSLSACDSEQETSPTIRMAEGEILERSVSDDMLPYDRLTSQPPLAEAEAEAEAEAGEGTNSEGTGQPE